MEGCASPRWATPPSGSSWETIPTAAERDVPRADAVGIVSQLDPDRGVRSVVPAYATVTVFYAPHEIRYADLLARVEAIPVGAEPAPPSDLVVVPVVYDGPDLPFLREHTGLSAEEIVRLHSEPVYLVRMIGFLPGFPYLSGLSPRLAAPRLPTPRRAVPAGSVGIGGAQTGVYPLESPGGWRLIGRTSLKLYDPAKEPGTLLKAGDRLRFQPVNA